MTTFVRAVGKLTKQEFMERIAEKKQIARRKAIANKKSDNPFVNALRGVRAKRG